MSFVNLHTHSYSKSEKVLEIVNQYPWDFKEDFPTYSIGIHPWYISENRLIEDLLTIEQKLRLTECLALGECGLDKRIEIPMQLQIEIFEKQILLAEKFQKPVILHLVAAFDELIEIKNRLQISVPMIVHGFSKSKELAKQLLDNGMYLSFGKYLIQNENLKDVFLSVPENRYFLETDSSDYKIEEVYSLVAKYKNQNILEIQKQVENNFKSVFTSAEF
ncbi:MAG: TatD DNase family protein [Flavobacterium sp.]|jgi:TatD DNase family protein